MRETVGLIIKDVLHALYQPFWFALILSVCVMFVYKGYPGVKVAARQWIGWFKTDRSFRKVFVLVFYTVLILFRTLLNRDLAENPLYDVVGTWGLYDRNGARTTEALENLLLFVPFSVMLLWIFRERLHNGQVRFWRTVGISVRITFLFSFGIEMLQLLLRLGSWQLSDLAFNTLGGLIGGLLYWCGYKLVHWRRSRRRE